MMNISRFVAVAGLAAAFAFPAGAHTLWLSLDNAAAQPQVKAIFGHPGKAEAADKGNIVALAAINGDGKAQSLLSDLKKNDDVVAASLAAAPKGTVMITAHQDGGFWVKTTTGRVKTNKLVIPDALESTWSQKFAKVLLPGADAKAYGRAAGQRLEIIPLASPFALKSGEKLKVRVEFDGKPLAGAEISVDETGTKAETPVKVTTGADGVAELQPPVGEILLNVGHKTAGSVAALADTDAFTATLVFVTKH